jgi:hypothetical protein
VACRTAGALLCMPRRAPPLSLFCDPPPFALHTYLRMPPSWLLLDSSRVQLLVDNAGFVEAQLARVDELMQDLDEQQQAGGGAGGADTTGGVVEGGAGGNEGAAGDAEASEDSDEDSDLLAELEELELQVMDEELLAGWPIGGQ